MIGIFFVVSVKQLNQLNHGFLQILGLIHNFPNYLMAIYLGIHGFEKREVEMCDFSSAEGDNE